MDPASMSVEIEQLRAEIERLKKENEDLRRWKAMDKPLTAAMGVVVADIQQLRAQNDKLRAALQEIAFENPSRPPAECARRALEEGSQ
jgi:cell division protein FtsB